MMQWSGTAGSLPPRHTTTTARYIEDERLEIDPWVRKRVLGGKTISASEYHDEIAEHHRAVAWFAEWMRGRDALLTPTLADHRDADRRGRRVHDAARDLDARRQLSRRVRAFASGGLLGGRIARSACN